MNRTLDSVNETLSASAVARQRRQARLILIVLLLAIPVVAYGAIRALRSTSNDPRQWLPRTFAATDTYDWFQAQFGSDEIAVVSWPGCTLSDPRVKQLADALQVSSYFDRARSGPGVMEQLTSPPLDLSRESAKRRLRGSLVAPESETTCLILSTSAQGRSDRVEAVAEIERKAEEVCQIAPNELRLAGPTVDAAAIDLESRRLLFELAGFSALISFVIAAARLASIRLAIMVLFVATYSTGVALAVLFFSGSYMNLLMTMLPPLVYVLSISSAVHLANYYRDAVAEEINANTDVALRTGRAIRTTVAHGWLPCTLAAVTTGIGLISLMMSKIDPIRMFGLYASIGIVVSVAILFIFLPAALRLFPPKLIKPSQRVASTAKQPSRYISFVQRHHDWLTAVCLTVMALAAWGLPHIKSTVKLQDRFLPGSDAVTDYQWLEDNIGPMVPLEIVVHFDKDDSRDTLKRMKLVAAVQGKIHSLDEPVATMSAINFSPRLPTGRSIGSVVERTVINSQRTKDLLVDARYLAMTEDEQLWRITVRANAIGDLDYGQFAETLQQTIDPLLQENGATGTYTGVIPLIYKAQRQLLQDLFRSFLAAFGVIAIVLVFVLRSLTAALLAMIPNLFPAVVVFGGLEWVDIPIQIGSVMTASAALGIAVDDTVHFLTWFRRGLTSGLSRGDALHDAFGRCAGAMIHTTLICSCGLLVFAVSSFVPILHFAWLMVLLLLSALVGDLVLLPSILAGPLGRGFESKTDR
tara:strand:+ start:1384 stop:3642 length:2259 start_codon:yes stop_codon:yes gene_type:complete